MDCGNVVSGRRTERSSQTTAATADPDWSAAGLGRGSAAAQRVSAVSAPPPRRSGAISGSSLNVASTAAHDTPPDAKFGAVDAGRAAASGAAAPVAATAFLPSCYEERHPQLSTPTRSLSPVTWHVSHTANTSPSICRCPRPWQRGTRPRPSSEPFADLDNGGASFVGCDRRAAILSCFWHYILSVEYSHFLRFFV
jgi:hypothetical protein